MPTKGAPDFTFSLPRERLSSLTPFSYATAMEVFVQKRIFMIAAKGYIITLGHLVWRACSIVILPGVGSWQGVGIKMGNKELLRDCIQSLAILWNLQNIKAMNLVNLNLYLGRKAHFSRRRICEHCEAYSAGVLLILFRFAGFSI